MCVAWHTRLDPNQTITQEREGGLDSVPLCPTFPDKAVNSSYFPQVPHVCNCACYTRWLGSGSVLFNQSNSLSQHFPAISLIFSPMSKFCTPSSRYYNMSWLDFWLLFPLLITLHKTLMSTFKWRRGHFYFHLQRTKAWSQPESLSFSASVFLSWDNAGSPGFIGFCSHSMTWQSLSCQLEGSLATFHQRFQGNARKRLVSIWLNLQTNERSPPGVFRGQCWCIWEIFVD